MHFHVYLPFAVLSTNMTSFPPSTCQFYSTIKTRTNAIFLNLPLNPLGKMLAQSLASPLSLIKIFTLTRFVLPCALSFAFRRHCHCHCYCSIRATTGLACSALPYCLLHPPVHHLRLNYSIAFSLPPSPSSPDIVRHYFMYPYIALSMWSTLFTFVSLGHCIMSDTQ